jgi:hypothetical protein
VDQKKAGANILTKTRIKFSQAFEEAANFRNVR